MIVWNKIKPGHYESESKRFAIRRSWWPPKGLHYHLYDKVNCVKKEENGFLGFCYEAVNANLCKLKAESILRREGKES